MNPPEPTDVDALIAEFIDAVERGQAPNPDDWLAQHPAHAAELAAFLRDLGRFGSFLGLSSVSCPDVTTDFRKPVAARAVPAASAGNRFAEYELLDEIGQGGMGTVYRARLIPTSLVVALKLIRPGGLDGAEAVRRFQEEVENAAALRHPNIVPIHHVGKHAEQPFYTMTLVERGSLDQHMGRFHGDFRGIAELLSPIARAVHHAHQRRILHRDLKPGNVLLDQDWLPHVADFGLAIRLDEAGGTTAVETPMGSLRWMAPEAARGDERLTTAVDVWALGVILYELLTGVRPFDGDDWLAVREAILKQQPIAPRGIDSRIPRDLEAVCLRCLEKDPERRYESANALALDLERWLRDEPVRARQAGRAERFVRWCRRNPGLAVGSVVLLACLAAGTIAGLSVTRKQASLLHQTVRHNNEYAARIVADTVRQELAKRSRKLTAAAGAEDLRNACSHADVAGARAALAVHFQNTPFTTVYLLNPEGRLIAHYKPGRVGRNPLRFEIEGKSYPGRDYFRGALRHRKEPEEEDRVHVSRAFASENDQLDKVAVSCTVRPKAGASPWVLAATFTTDSTLLGLKSPEDSTYTSVLLAPRDTEPPRPGAPSVEPGYVILFHPAFVAGERSVLCPPDHPGLIAATDDKPELRSTLADPPFAAEDSYRDPVADHGHPQYEGEWLTGSARVGNTELVVLVQQRFSEAVAPLEGPIQQFVAWVAGLVGFGFVSFACAPLDGVPSGHAEKRALISESRGRFPT